MTLLKLALRSVRSRPGRFLLTSLAVVIGVALTSAVFVFTDSLRETFGDLSQDIESGYDLAIRSEVPFGDRINAAVVPVDVPNTISAVDGVATVIPRIIEFGVTPIGPDGDVVTGSGPNIGLSWDGENPDPRLFPSAGRPPSGPGEFTTDAGSAEENDLVVGDSYTVQTAAGAGEYELVGTFTFAAPDDSALTGAVLIAFDTPVALDVLNGGLGYNDVTVVVDEGADQTEVGAAIADALPTGLEVVPREELVEEQAAEFNEFIDIFRTILLVFAFVILLVAAFIIYNVFSIIVGQRIQEIGLLRALGATGRQITQSVALEAFLVGAFATVTGVLLGLPIAAGLQALLAALDFGPDQGSTPLRPTTVIVAAILGIGLTMASAIWPALRARQVSPMAALRDGVDLQSAPRANPLFGGLLVLAGVLLVVLGFVLDEYLLLLLLTVVAGIFVHLGAMRINARLGRFALSALAVVLIVVAMTANLRASMLLALLGASALTAFLGLNVVSPTFATPAARFLGAPIARLGIPGKLARENAGRNPQRTATAASALMIGLALVTTVAVVASSLKATFAEVLDNAVAADFIVVGDLQGPPGSGTFPPELAEEIGNQTDIDGVLGVQWNLDSFVTEADGEVRTSYSTNLAAIPEHFDIDLVDADESLYGPDAVILHTDQADDFAVGVGDTIDVELVDQSTRTMKVAGIYDDLAIFDAGWIFDTSFFEGSTTTARPLDLYVTALAADGADVEAVRSSISSVTADYPQLDVFTKDEFQDNQEGQIDQVLVVVNVLLFVSVVLALLGVAITLALSVFERTREIGLTRAVGGTRRQVKRMVRGEGVIVALFGGVLGVGLGLVFGAACVQIIPDDFVKDLAIPWGSLIAYLIIAAVAGLLAAFFPARRAAKLNVLDAISFE